MCEKFGKQVQCNCVSCQWQRHILFVNQMTAGKFPPVQSTNSVPGKAEPKAQKKRLVLSKKMLSARIKWAPGGV